MRKVRVSRTVGWERNESNLAPKMCVSEGSFEGEGNGSVREPMNYTHDEVSRSLTDLPMYKCRIKERLVGKLFRNQTYFKLICILLLHL